MHVTSKRRARTYVPFNSEEPADDSFYFSPARTHHVTCVTDQREGMKGREEAAIEHVTARSTEGSMHRRRYSVRVRMTYFHTLFDEIQRDHFDRPRSIGSCETEERATKLTFSISQTCLVGGQLDFSRARWEHSALSEAPLVAD
jgi:hypothetical protein